MGPSPLRSFPPRPSMTERQLIIPASMQRLAERAGYAPAVKVGATVYCAGQVGRTP